MGLLSGPIDAVRAAGLLMSHPRLLALSVIPAVVTLLLSIVGIWAAVSFGDDLVLRLWPEPEASSFLHGVWWTVTQLVRLSSAVLAVFITPWLVMLVGLPLCEPLAARIDALLGGEVVEGSFLGDMAASASSAVVIFAIGVSGSIAFFVLGLIPGVGLLTGPFVALVWTPLFLCFDLYDGPLARRQVGVRDKIRALTGQPVAAISHGLTGIVLLAIPVVNLVGLPIAVDAGVMGVRRLESDGHLAPQSARSGVGT